MEFESQIARIDAEWDVGGFFWDIRDGHFRWSDFERALAAVAAVSIPDSLEALPRRLVEVLWYIPIYMGYQVERIVELGGDRALFARASEQLQGEVERILGGP